MRGLVTFAGYIVSIWVLFGMMSVIWELWGAVALVAALFLFPLTWAAFPFYAGTVLDNWGYLQWSVIGAVLITVGSAMRSR